MVPTCHVPPQEATKAQQRRQLFLCVGGTGLSPSHARCFGVPDSARALSQCLGVKQQLAARGIARKLGAATQWEETQPL